MARQELKKSNNELIGYIDTESDGRQVLTRPNNELLGYFDPQTNTTSKPNNELVGYGNLLTTLL